MKKHIVDLSDLALRWPKFIAASLLGVFFLWSDIINKTKKLCVEKCEQKKMREEQKCLKCQRKKEKKTRMLKDYGGIYFFCEIARYGP